MFSIAVVFYEMLTGCRVREGFKQLFDRCARHGQLPAISDYMKVIAANPPIPIRQRNPDIPESLARIIDKALCEVEIPHEAGNMREMLKKLRYPDAGAFRSALVQVLKELRVPASQKNIRQSYPVAQQTQIVEKHDAGQISPGTVMYTTIQPAAKQEVALLILDLVQSTQYVLNVGDTSFATVIGSIYRRVKTHSSASDLIFLKGTGDGFFAVFHTVQAAFSLASTFLETPVHQDVHIRMALHRGAVKTGPDGDVLGTEVRRVYQIEGVKKEDQVELTIHESVLPEENRILATQQAMIKLADSDRIKFKPVGKFRLTDFDEFCELWVLHK